MIIQSKKINLNSKLQIIATDQANNFRSFELHILLIYDIVIYNNLLSMKSSDYFNGHACIEENPNTYNLYKLDIIPGKAYSPINIFEESDENKKLIGIIIFINTNKSSKKSIKKLILKSEDMDKKPLIKIKISQDGISLE